MLATLFDYLAQVDGATLVPQLGIGGLLVWAVVKWMSNLQTTVERGFENLNHKISGLTKAIYLDLAERSTPGSFIREEAKRMVEKERRSEETTR